jgi:hypothetical protein
MSAEAVPDCQQQVGGSPGSQVIPESSIVTGRTFSEQKLNIPHTGCFFRDDCEFFLPLANSPNRRADNSSSLGKMDPITAFED